MSGGISKGVILAALISTLCGIGMTGVSSWILHKSLQMYKNPTLVTAKDLLHQVNTFFGGTTGLYDLDVIFRILISASASALVGGGVQFLSSFCLLLCSASGKMNRPFGVFWVIVQCLVMFAIGGALLCILTNELEINFSLQIFLISAGADVIVIIFNCLIIALSDCQTTAANPTRSLGAVNYAMVPKLNAPVQKENDTNHKLNVNDNIKSAETQRNKFNGVQVFPGYHGTSSKV